MAVHVYNISVVLLRSKSPGWLLHATAHDIHLDGSIVNSAKSLLVNVTLGEAEVIQSACKHIIIFLIYITFRQKCYIIHLKAC